MGIEPIEVCRKISDLGCLNDPSAMEVRIFVLRRATSGNWKLLLRGTREPRQGVCRSSRSPC